MPAPSTVEQGSRGVKRSRTPDYNGNGLAVGDQEDGTSATAWEKVDGANKPHHVC